MLPSRHVALTVPLSVGVWFFTRSPLAGFLCFASGVLIDIDHLFDYIVNFGSTNLSPKAIYRGCKKLANVNESKRLHLFFHAIEMGIILWLATIVTKNIYLFALALGYSGHLLLDVPNARIKPSSYFMTIRIINGFKTIKFVRDR